MTLLPVLCVVLVISSSAVSYNLREVPGQDCNENPLHAAVRSGILARVEAVVDQSLIHGKNCRGFTPMHLAIASDDRDMITILYEKKFDLSRSYARGNTYLHFAVELGSRNAARKLVDFGCPVDSANEAGVTPLGLAIARNDRDMVYFLARAGANLRRTRPGSGETYVQLAVRRGASVALAALLEEGLSPEEHRLFQVPPVELAVFGNDVSSLGVLKIHGAKVEVSEGRRVGGRSLLHLAARLGHREAVDWLLAEGEADPNARDHLGNTPLHIAARWNRTEVCRELLAARANTNLRDGRGHTSLHYAKEMGFQEFASVLINVGAKDH